MPQQRFRKAFYYTLAFIAPLMILTCALQLWSARLDVPISYSGDVLENSLRVKAFMDGSWSNVTRLSTPHHYSIFLYPLASHLDYAIACGFSLFTKNVGSALIFGWLFKVMVASLLATWSLKKLDISPSIALLSGILFSLAPYAIAKNTYHFNISIYLVAPIATMCLLLLRNKFSSLDRRDKVLFFSIAVLLGFNGTYLAFFSCFILSTVILVGVVSRSGYMIKPSLLALLIITVTTVINLAPSMMTLNDAQVANDWLQNSKATPMMANRYGLHIRELLLPVQYHPIESLREITKSADSTFLPQTESKHMALGLFASIGFLFILLYGFIQLATGKHIGPKTDYLGASSSLVIACLLLAVVGGFSNFVSLFLLDTIRVYMRITTFIAFFSVYASAVLLDALKAKVLSESTDFKKFIFGIIVFILLIAGVADVRGSFSWDSTWSQAAAQHDEVAKVVKEMEETLPKNAMVYQLPDLNVLQVSTYTKDVYPHLRPYLISSDLRWSYAHRVRFDESYYWHETFNEQPLEDQIELLLYAGFDGIWVDRYDKSITTDYIKSLDGIVSAPPLKSSTGRYIFYTIAQQREALITELGEDIYQQRQLAALKEPSLK